MLLLQILQKNQSNKDKEKNVNLKAKQNHKSHYISNENNTHSDQGKEKDNKLI